jgi:hypothetical protein
VDEAHDVPPQQGVAITRRPVLTTVTAFAFAAVAVLGVAGCTTTGPGSLIAGPDADGDPDDSGAVTLGECVIGTWSGDVVDLGEQLLEFFSQVGSPVTDVTSTGTITLEVDATSMTYTSDVTHQMTATLDDDMDMVVTQTQVGVSSGDWTAEGDTIAYSNWTEGIEIESTVTIGGVDSGVPLDVPAGDSADIPVTTTCDGDTLTTHPEGTPFTTTWARVG